MCPATIHSFGWIVNSYKRAGNIQRLRSHGPVDETPSGFWAGWELVWLFLPFLLGNQTQNCSFCTTAAVFACTQRAVVSRLHIHMYSSAYVYIYTYGVVYIFCIDIQIGLVLSKYHKCFVQSVLPTMSWPYYLFSASVLLFLSWDRVTFIPLEAAQLLVLFTCCFIQGVSLLSSSCGLRPSSFCLEAPTCELSI